MLFRSVSQSRYGDVTSIGMYNTYSIPGQSGMGVSLDIYYNASDHSAFTTSLLNASLISDISIYFEDNDVIMGDGFVTSVAITSQSGDIVRGQIGLIITGPFSVNGSPTVNGEVETPPE